MSSSGLNRKRVDGSSVIGAWAVACLAVLIFGMLLEACCLLGVKKEPLEVSASSMARLTDWIDRCAG